MKNLKKGLTVRRFIRIAASFCLASAISACEPGQAATHKIVTTSTTNAELDADGDGVEDGPDNCSDVKNPDQKDTDGDGIGDACDADDDNDGALDGVDNCPLMANPKQENADGDLQGDICDADIDNDGIANGVDNCPLNPNPAQSNQDGDAQGDACDADKDGDGIANTTDNCPTVVNPNQENQDGDAQGDACDTDQDGDGVLNTVDNCPTVANPDQANADTDSQGDACDDDCDGDGVPRNGAPCHQDDLDKDGYCTGTAPVSTTCPQGGGDCNDGNNMVRPNGAEVCDNMDNDCDGQKDEGCVPPACMVAADCDDTNACTTDGCSNGQCSHTAIEGCCLTAANCDDADACTTDSCSSNACSHAAKNCDDSVANTVDACDPLSGVCSHTPPACTADCSGGKVCGDDGCGGSCGSCGVGELCSAGKCMAGSSCTSAAQCNDNVSTTSDFCFMGECAHVAQGQCRPFGIFVKPSSSAPDGKSTLEWWKATSSVPRNQKVLQGTYLSQTGECSVTAWDFDAQNSFCVTVNGESPLVEQPASPGTWGCVHNQ